MKKQATTTMSIRSYRSKTYIILYLLEDNQISLLAIKHQRQLSFHFSYQSF